MLCSPHSHSSPLSTRGSLLPSLYTGILQGTSLSHRVRAVLIQREDKSFPEPRTMGPAVPPWLPAATWPQQSHGTAFAGLVWGMRQPPFLKAVVTVG